ncbi:MAG TPA: ribonuclease III [Chromatiales bacterium]|nr:ribonuclease III [Thiotrichales bacterium]HIP67326.1 ribonuclease III [Chromatiales bacterium]
MQKSQVTLFSLLDDDVKSTPLFQQAITHRSASKDNNECLEFLGDSVLSLIITEYLYQHLPDADEGELSRLRASLVNGETLGQIGKENNLGDYIKLGSGELKSGGHRRESIMEDALEAIIGAVFSLRGFDYTKNFVLQLFSGRLKNLPDPETLKDPKTRLQEWLQAKGDNVPVYKVLEVSGQAHQQIFTAECRIESQNIATQGKGSSRRKAEQAAAEAAFKKLSDD